MTDWADEIAKELKRLWNVRKRFPTSLISDALRKARSDALVDVEKKIHWMFNADGTKGERRVAGEIVAAIRALKGERP